MKKLNYLMCISDQLLQDECLYDAIRWDFKNGYKNRWILYFTDTIVKEKIIHYLSSLTKKTWDNYIGVN
jgi:hypothetical protein